jgi:hypothetical protein
MTTGGSTGIIGTSDTGGSTTLPLDAGLSCDMSATQFDNIREVYFLTARATARPRLPNLAAG